MTTTEAVRDRILHLCEERGLTINRLATICALPPSSIKRTFSTAKARTPSC